MGDMEEAGAGRGQCSKIPGFSWLPIFPSHPSILPFPWAWIQRGFPGEKTPNCDIFNSPGKFEINADFHGKWELGLEQKPRNAQGMLSGALIHGNTFPALQTPQIPEIPEIPLPRPRLSFSTRFLNGGDNSRGSEFPVEGAAQLQVQQFLCVLPGSEIQN